MRGTQGALVGGDLGVPVDRRVASTAARLAVGEAFFAIRGHEPRRPRLPATTRPRAARPASSSHSLPDDLPPARRRWCWWTTRRGRSGRLAAYHRARFTLPVAAVTGSNGKTTTKEMMASVLGALGPVLKPESSFNNQWGCRSTLFRLGPEHRAAALELGANQPGEIAALARDLPAHRGRRHRGGRRPHRVLRLARRRAGGEERAGARDPAGRRGGPERRRSPRPRDAGRRAAARVLTFGTRGAADVRAVGPAARRADGRALHARHRAGRSAPCAWPSPAGTTSSTRSPRPGVGRALGLALDQIAAGLEAARPAKGRCVWRRAGGIAHPRRHLQRQPRPRCAPRSTRSPRGAGARAPGGGAGRHARAGRDRRGGAPGGRARRRRRRGRPSSSASGAAPPAAVEAARAGRARREPPRDHLRGHGGAAPQAARARRRACSSRARGACAWSAWSTPSWPASEERMADALRPPRAAGQVLAASSTSSGTSRSGRRWRR